MKYAPSALLGRLSRSSGSTTASHNRYGAYLRNRVIPVNPRSSKQMEIRVAFGGWSQYWRTMSDAQRSAWASLGAQMQRVDSLGQTYNLTGLQAFTSLNQNSLNLGGGIVTTAPLFQNVLPLTSISGSADTSSSTMSIDFAPTPIPADTYVIIQATAPKSAGINFVPRSAFKQLTVLAPTDTSPQSIYSTYVSIFGVPPTGSKIFVRAIIVGSSFIASAPLETSFVVQA